MRHLFRSLAHQLLSHAQPHCTACLHRGACKGCYLAACPCHSGSHSSNATKLLTTLVCTGMAVVGRQAVVALPAFHPGLAAVGDLGLHCLLEGDVLIEASTLAMHLSGKELQLLPALAGPACCKSPAA